MPHMKSQPIAGIVFDLDGTLVHSAPDIAAALNIVLDQNGLARFPIAETFKFIGEGAKSLIIRAFAARGRALNDDEAVAISAQYIATYTEYGSPDTTLFPTVRETL